MLKSILKNGDEVLLRVANTADAPEMIDFYNIVGGETDFLSFGKNEFKTPLMDYEKFLENAAAEKNSIILIAEHDKKIISIATITSSQKERSRHVGTFGIVIQEDYTGLGLGSMIMKYLMNWAASNGVTRKITLHTREDNRSAISLYQNFGFEKEGLLKKDNYIHDVFYNTLIMSYFI